MTRDSAPGPSSRVGKNSALLAIAVGGGVAGSLDLLQACILFGWDIPLVIAGGLLGPRAFQGGAGIYVLGVALHFFIACSAAAVYYGTSRKLIFMKEHPLVCGLVLWRRGGRCNEADRVAAFRAPLPRALQTSRPHSRAGGAHGYSRATDFFQRSALREIIVGPASIVRRLQRSLFLNKSRALTASS